MASMFDVVCIDNSDESAEMRGIAAEWHGGINCPLYAYVSTGSVLKSLQGEIRDLLTNCDVNVHGEDAIDDLTSLHEHIRKISAR